MIAREFVRRHERVRVLRLAVVTWCVATLGSVSPIFGHNDPSDRITELSHRIEDDPENAILYLERGKLHRTAGEWRSAEPDFRRAVALDHELGRARLYLATTLLEPGDFAEAETLSTQYIDGHADDVPGRVARARARAALGDHAGAVEDWTVVVARTTSSGRGNPEHYLQLSSSLTAVGEILDALAVLDDGANRLGGPIVLALRAIELELELDCVDDALARIARIENRATRKDTWAARRARILEEQGRADQALSAYGDALTAIAALPESRRHTEMGLALETEIRDALHRLREATKSTESDP